MIRVNRENNLYPKCGHIKEPITKECPKCGIIFAQIKSEHKNENNKNESKENLSETSKIDISEIKLETSSGNKRNFFYNLNTRAINLFLFVVTAIIAGILIFLNFLYLKPQ